MPPVTVLVLAPALAPDAGPLTRHLGEARSTLAEHHRQGFLAAGADVVVVRREPPDDTPFGTRLRRLMAELRPGGLVVLGAGSIPLATAADRRELVDVASADVPGALANHRYSADVLAVAQSQRALSAVPPDLRSDNALPRWLAEVAGVPVRDFRARRRLAWTWIATGSAPARGGPRRSGPAASQQGRDGAGAGTARPAGRSRRQTRVPSSWSPAGHRPRTSAGQSATRGRGPEPWSRSGGSGPRPSEPRSGGPTAGPHGASSV